ncbi:MAG: hypothetical protein ACYTFI_06215 [Planctomycetota bacterium]|jgi:hypothetical protein
MPVSIRTGTIRFVGRVVDIETLGRYEGRVIPTHFDLGWVVTVEIISVSPDDTILKRGKQTAFAVHSPTHVFGLVGAARECVGNSYEFAVERTRKDGGIRWWRLRATAAK